jgi:7-cyano-7-deazaguanine synthase
LSPSRKGETAICIVSGGLDSLCVCGYLKFRKNYRVKALTFSYGQRAGSEIMAAKRISNKLDIEEHHTIDMNFMKELYGNSNALTSEQVKLGKNFKSTLIVPVRNAIFITIAVAWAVSCNAKLVAFGAHAEDIRYPDCRPEFVKSLTKSLNLAEKDRISSRARNKISIWSPSLDGLTKFELVKIGYQIVGDLVFQSWSCYFNGVKVPGRGLVHCGMCESCINRKVAFSKAGIEDKTIYANIRK